MIKSYLKIALRNVLKLKIYSLINIAGLAIGMACFILIMLWVQDELSFDRFNTKADRIYRLCTSANFGSPQTWAFAPVPAGPTMKEEFPEVINAVRFDYPYSGPVEYGEKLIQEDGICFADNSIFEVFSFPLISGDPHTALTTPYSVVITRDMAAKYFGAEDPLGKIIKIYGGEFTVTGVVENIPNNSHFKFNMARSMETLMKDNREQMEMWFNIQYYTYLLLDKNSDVKQLEQKLPAFVENHFGEALKQSGGKLELFLQPLTRIHLYSKLDGELSARGDINNVYLFSAIAVFIILIACVNFINLSTARAATRSREVGLRKTLGANRGQLIRQFLGEAIVLSLMALALAYILVEIALPHFNSLAGRHVSLHLNWITNLAVLVGLALLVGLLAGAYPALFLSSYQPVKTLKGASGQGTARTRMRSVLVMVQFIISITLICGTITIYGQLHYFRHKNLGFDKEHVVVLPGLTARLRATLPAIKEELRGIPDVQNVAAASFIPGRGARLAVVGPEGFPEDQPMTMSILDIDDDYLRTMRIELVEGRNFSADMPTDRTESILINETAKRILGWDHPLGKSIAGAIVTDSGIVGLERKIIGVVRDFHQSSLHKKIEPMIIGQNSSEFRALILKMAPGNIPAALKKIEGKWKEFDPHLPFNYYFLDESFDARYKAEQRLGAITLIFSLLAVFIACLGLFGMSAYAAEQRTKEIGIRKVFGASIAGIVAMLSRKFLILVLLANIIAWPMAYYALDRWLRNFAYRTDFGLWIFVASGAIALLIALATVGFQSIKAAVANPVKSLRYE